MSEPGMLHSDSFSADQDAPAFGGDSHQNEENNKPREGSPIFGLNRGGQKESAMFVDDKFQEVESPSRALNRNTQVNDSQLTPEQIKDKIKDTKRLFNQQQEEFKEQLLHIETINMMTKYQLVFLKVETALSKLHNIHKIKQQNAVSRSFHKIQRYSTPDQEQLKYKSYISYFKLNQNVQKFADTLTKLRRSPLLLAFKSIQCNGKLQYLAKTYTLEKEKYSKSFQEALQSKDQDLRDCGRKIEDLNSAISQAKAREQDINTKIRTKEKQLVTLESEKVEMLKNAQVDYNIDMQSLNGQLQELQQENDELKDKLYSAEDSVGFFIKDMSDLLDSHEMSANLSIDNQSFHPHDYDDENAVRHDRALGQRQGGHGSGAGLAPSQIQNLSQNKGKPGSSQQQGKRGGSGYNRNYQINYCCVQYDNPALNIPMDKLNNVMGQKNGLLELLEGNTAEKTPEYEVIVKEEEQKQEQQPQFMATAMKSGNQKTTESTKYFSYASNSTDNNTSRRNFGGTRRDRSGGSREGSRRSNDDDDDDDDEPNEAQQKILREADKIQMSLRYILGLYKLHSLFVESKVAGQ